MKVFFWYTACIEKLLKLGGRDMSFYIQIKKKSSKNILLWKGKHHFGLSSKAKSTDS